MAETIADGDPISVAVARELPPGHAQPRKKKLSPADEAALAILVELTGTRRDGVPEKECREACVNGRKVSGSENVESCKKAMQRIVQKLRGFIEIRNHRYFLPGEARDWRAEFDNEDEAAEGLI